MEAIERLRNYMLKEELTQTEMANRLDISITQVNRWLRKGKMSKAWIALLRNKGII